MRPALLLLLKLPSNLLPPKIWSTIMKRLQQTPLETPTTYLGEVVWGWEARPRERRPLLWPGGMEGLEGRMVEPMKGRDTDESEPEALIMPGTLAMPAGCPCYGRGNSWNCLAIHRRILTAAACAMISLCCLSTLSHNGYGPNLLLFPHSLV